MGDESCKILKGADEIADYARISRHTFYAMLVKGFPALKVGPVYFAHKDNIDEFFRRITFVTGPQPAVPEEIGEVEK